MFEVTEMHNFRKVILWRAESFEAAKKHVNEYYTVICMEDDADYPGCADIYTGTGRVLAIQPENFRI